MIKLFQKILLSFLAICSIQHAAHSMNRQQALTILNLAPNATEQEIRKAYLRLAAIHHPDKWQHAAPPTQDIHAGLFKEISNAYNALTITQSNAPSSKQAIEEAQNWVKSRQNPYIVDKKNHKGLIFYIEKFFKDKESTNFPGPDGIFDYIVAHNAENIEPLLHVPIIDAPTLKAEILNLAKTIQNPQFYRNREQTAEEQKRQVITNEEDVAFRHFQLDSNETIFKQQALDAARQGKAAIARNAILQLERQARTALEQNESTLAANIHTPFKATILCRNEFTQRERGLEFSEWFERYLLREQKQREKEAIQKREAISRCPVQQPEQSIRESLQQQQSYEFNAIKDAIPENIALQREKESVRIQNEQKLYNVFIACMKTKKSFLEAYILRHLGRCTNVLKIELSNDASTLRNSVQVKFEDIGNIDDLYTAWQNIPSTEWRLKACRIMNMNLERTHNQQKSKFPKKALEGDEDETRERVQRSQEHYFTIIANQARASLPLTKLNDSECSMRTILKENERNNFESLLLLQAQANSARLQQQSTQRQNNTPQPSTGTSGSYFNWWPFSRKK